VQVVPLKIDHAAPGLIHHVDIGDVPLRGHFPVEHFGAARDLAHRERNLARHERQGPAHAVAGDAAADRKHLAGEGVAALADRIGRGERRRDGRLGQMHAR
jgi:hypothetical protein